MAEVNELLKEQIWRLLLEEIKCLRGFKDGSDSEDKALAILSDIFCKFAIVDAMRGLGSIKGPLRMGEEDPVVVLKKEIKAELDDLKRMRIPRLKNRKLEEVREVARRKNEEEPYYFPHFMYLPKEVRYMILEYIDSISDKINLTKAIPSDGMMMKWNAAVYEFGLIYPDLMKTNALTASDLINLCNADTYFENFIRSHFVENMNDNFIIPVASLSQISRELTENNKQLEIIPFCVYLDLDSINNQETKREQLVALGNKIWDCNIFTEIDFAQRSRPDILRDVQNSLAQMPNLKCLRLAITSTQLLDFNEQEAQQILNILLPDLPHLQYLTLDTLELDCGRIWIRLLQKYHAGLVELNITSPISIPDLPVLPCPHLSKLELNDFNAGTGDMTNCIRLLQSFSGAPLKTIRICGNLDDDSINHETFPNLMRFLAPFGQTLEDLSVEIPSIHKRNSWHQDNPDYTWVMTLDFPKLKRFHLRTYPGDWTFLVQFQALEKLIIDTHWWWSPNLTCQPSYILNLVRKTDSICESGLWKLIPSLREIILRKSLAPRGFQEFVGPEQVFTVSRANCIAFEKKKAKSTFNLS